MKIEFTSAVILLFIAVVVVLFFELFSIIRLTKEMKHSSGREIKESFREGFDKKKERFNMLVMHFSSLSEAEIITDLKFYESKIAESRYEKLVDAFQKTIYPVITLMFTLLLTYVTIMVTLTLKNENINSVAIQELVKIVGDLFNGVLMNQGIIVLSVTAIGLLVITFIDTQATKIQRELIAFRIKSLEVSLEIIKKQNSERQKIQDLYLSLTKKLH
ncbi:hypothetical protein [Paenibacillus chitinolyticus]